MKTARLSALAAATKAAATLCQAWAGRRAPLVLLAGTLILCAMPTPVLGNLFVVDRFSHNGTIGEYTNSGATVNASLITGLGDPLSIAVSGGFLYVTNPVAGTIGKYTTSGATINASLISGLDFPTDIEVSGGDLYISERGNGRIGKYTTSGATVNASLITGLLFPSALGISGTNLFVGDGGTLGEYTISGLTVNASLVAELQAISDVEVSGSSLFISHFIGDDGVVGKYNVNGTAIDPMLISPHGTASDLAISGTDLFFVGDTVGKYTTSGMKVADPLISGLTLPYGIAVEGPAAVPETLSTLWLGLTAAGLLGFALLRRRAL